VTLLGTYYTATSSTALDVTVRLEAEGTLHIESPEFHRVEQVRDCQLSEPLGRMARHFTLPDGARLEITDLDTLAAWEHRHHRHTSMHFVHWLESRWRWVGAAVLFLLAFMAVGYIWGLPFAAKRIAMRLPPKIGAVATDQARTIFTRLFDFEPSKLSAERRLMIELQFQKMAAVMEPGNQRNYRLEFFAAPFPNAFALPDGLVCITDELIEETKDDKEIYGVLAHEVVHVREQHGLRSVLQNSAVFLIWTLMTGDISTVAGLGSALPALLAESGYSRGFEQEADLGAAEYMIKAGWSTKPLADILQRIDPEHTHLGDAGEALSSHPLTEKRVQVLADYEKTHPAPVTAPAPAP
jgi:Zn-dependent protease with chaperone function